MTRAARCTDPRDAASVAFHYAARRMNDSTPAASTWRWLALWCALLLPLAVLLPPIPIDETRYLTAAWEMFNSGQWLVPTVNGAWYSDKSPLLFWLIAGGWKIFGVHTWVARVDAIAVAVAILLLTRRLAARLGLDARASDTALWLLAGGLGFAVFSTAIMFDLLLTLGVLGALHGLLDMDAGRWWRGFVVFGIAIGFGMLAKGPVLLLHVLPVALLAPWWSEAARKRALRWYLVVIAAVVLGTVILACWLLPAAVHAGPSYWQPLVDKVSGRLAKSFAHRRPLWWYLPLLPVLLLPWVLAVRAPRAAWAGLLRGRFARFLWCWWLIPFIAFCAISGKQVHYLLPLLPAWLLAAAWLLQQPGARLRTGLFSAFALLAGAGIVAMPWLAAKQYGFAPDRLAVGFALVAVIVAVGAWRVRGGDVRTLALLATALLSATMLAAVTAYWPALDVRPEAAFVRQTLAARVPIAHVEWHNGLFGYTGRLHQPLPWIPTKQIEAWCRAHPDGILLSSDSHDAPKGTTPFRTWPYFLAGDRRIAAWRAADVVRAKP